MTFDLDAVKNEAGDIPFDFTFGGDKYQLPAHVDVLAAASLEGGKVYEGLHRLLGDDQWDRLLASPSVLDEVKLKALLDAYGEHLGLSLGESAGSTDS